MVRVFYPALTNASASVRRAAGVGRNVGQVCANATVSGAFRKTIRSPADGLSPEGSARGSCKGCSAIGSDIAEYRAISSRAGRMELNYFRRSSRNSEAGCTLVTSS